jgi:orotidine-5'-phosphate decarboxylase
LGFRQIIEQSAQRNDSRIVLALDFQCEVPKRREMLFTKAEEILEAVHPCLCGVKFNHHLVLPLGLFDGVKKLVEKVHDFALPAIMDCKINDIGSTNEVIAENYYTAGFDAVTANPFIGWQEGLEPIFDVSHRKGKGVILLVYMSHKGAPEGYGQTVIDQHSSRKSAQYSIFAEKAIDYRADGAVVGATYPEKIKEIHEILKGNVPIFSPGVGAQGGEIQSALRSGSEFIIVGRSIVDAPKPEEAAKTFQQLAAWKKRD